MPTRTSSLILLAGLLTILAAIPRLYHLGDLGFYMDEETTAFASRTLAEGKGPQMPSGMPYYRSLPHSWLNAVSARVFGLNEEFSYRLPGALLGILTVPLLFLSARPFVGTQVAFIAALLLAFSEWHIITSRQARMYAPFLFFYTASAFSILAWAKTDKVRYFLASAIFFVISSSFHNLGVFAALIPLIALYIPAYTKAPPYKLISFSVVGGLSAYLYGKIFVAAPYRDWISNYNLVVVNRSGISIADISPVDMWILVPGVIGLALGVWLARKSAFPDNANGWQFRIIARYVLAISFACFSATGQLHAAFISITFLLYLQPDAVLDYVKRVKQPLLAISTIAVAVVAVLFVNHDVRDTAKSLLIHPYPNWITLGEISPGVTLLFLTSMLYLALKEKHASDRDAQAMVICGVFPLVIVGLFKASAPARYLIEAYPFILVSAAGALYAAANYLQKRISLTPSYSTSAVILIVISGILGGHGLKAAYKVATLQHGGTLNEAALIFPFYPDHKSPGQFVRSHRQPGDIVVAEDILEQEWYAGDVDYWLRNPGTHKKFLYEADDGRLHDIYISSTIITPEILGTLKSNKKQRIWIITSGETAFYRSKYLDEEQRRWLEHIEKTNKPLFTGMDDVTKVYCLNCGASN